MPPDVLLNPAVVVEVLSASTEAHDRGVKWAAYQRIEHYRREADGWHYQVLGVGDVIMLANGARIDVDAIYLGAFDLEGG
jgi:hypothetical protein